MSAAGVANGVVGALGRALSTRRRRLLAAVAALVYLFVYLWAIQHLVVTRTDLSRFADIPSVQVAPDWTSKLLAQRASFSYEPVVAVYPMNHVQILIAPLNVAIGLALGLLVGLNVALAVHVFRTAVACRARSFGGLLGAAPALLTGFVCCAPTAAVALGAQFTVFLIAWSDWLLPAAFGALALSLLWNTRRVGALERELATIEAPDRLARAAS